MVDVAEIKIWGKFLGAVRWDENRQLASFQYSPDFIKLNLDVSPIHMPIHMGTRIFTFPNLRISSEQPLNTFKGLPGLLADSLPDRFGDNIINLWLAMHGHSVNSMNPVEQLCFMGNKAMGALEFEPAQKKLQHNFDIELSSLIGAVRKIMLKKKLLAANFNEDDKEALAKVIRVGVSKGGDRPKIHIAFNENTGVMKSGQIEVDNSLNHWILKLNMLKDDQLKDRYNLARIEYAYYLMALDCDIHMMPSKLLEDSGSSHFMTKRFDRDGNTKHHVQTWCAIQHYDYHNHYMYSYEQLFQTMRLLRLSYLEAEQLFKRMVFNVLTANYKDHSKNFAFILKEGHSWELAPAYNLCFAYDPDNIWLSQHSISINAKHNNITRADLMTIAKANNIKKAATIIKHVSKVVLNWKYYAQLSGVEKDQAAQIAYVHSKLVL